MDSDAQEIPSFELPSRTDRMSLNCLGSTLNAAIKRYDDSELWKHYPELATYVESTRLQWRMDQQRVRLLLHDQEDFTQAGDLDRKGIP